jgi:hypothetical protein
MHILKNSLITFTALMLGACATVEPYDYTQLLAKQPKSILVLPPLNNSIDVKATPIYLSTVTRPLAERGYYVFPVSVINDMMNENGLPTAAEMHEVPLSKFNEIIDPDAVLYVTINDWGTKYEVFASTTVVDISARLLDTDTETLLWNGNSRVVYDPNASNQAGLLGALVGAVVGQIMSNKFDASPQVSSSANSQLFFSENLGLLPGPYMPEPITVTP